MYIYKYVYKCIYMYVSMNSYVCTRTLSEVKIAFIIAQKEIM